MGSSMSNSVLIWGGDRNVTISRTKENPVVCNELRFVDGEANAFYLWHGTTMIAGPWYIQNIYNKNRETHINCLVVPSITSPHAPHSTLDHLDYKISYVPHMLVGCGPAGTLVTIKVVKYR